MKRQIWLIGLPGSGKTTTGALVARELKVDFVDLDAVIERKKGLSIASFFARHGEAAFREAEREVAAEVMARGPAVVAPGGGWAAQPGAIESAGTRCFVVYLRTSPREAVRRIGDTRTRPLLAGADPAERMNQLLAAREAFYLRAEASVDTDGLRAADVAREIVKLARSSAGW